MSALELGSLILAAEFALVAWAILFFLLRRQRQRLESDQAQAEAAAAQIATTEVSRRDALTKLFEATYGMRGDELAAKVAEYVAREQAFYTVMLSLYLERDGTRLKEIPEELAKLLTPWANLKPHGLIPAGDVEHLADEKAQLAAELDSTRQTLDELMKEYAAAFGRAPPMPATPPPPVLADLPAASDEDLVFEEIEATTLPQNTDGFDLADDETPHEFEIADGPIDVIVSANMPSRSVPDSAPSAPPASKTDSSSNVRAPQPTGAVAVAPDPAAAEPSASDKLAEAAPQDEIAGLADLSDPAFQDPVDSHLASKS